MSKVINKTLNFLHMNNKVKTLFTPKQMISFRSARKMGGYLVKAKLYPEERTNGSFKCGSKRCEVCLNINETFTFATTDAVAVGSKRCEVYLNVNEAFTFASTVAGETYVINHKFNCNGRCLVYLLTSNCCKNRICGSSCR